MINIIKNNNYLIDDILIQQKIPHRYIKDTDILNLKDNDTLIWDMSGFVEPYNFHNIVNFLNSGGKIIIVPDENYKIFSRVESVLDGTWSQFISLVNNIDKQNQIFVLIEGKVYQSNDKIKCTPVHFGYFEIYDPFITNYYNYDYIINRVVPIKNYGTAAVMKPTRIFRKKFYKKIQQTNIDISQILMPTLPLSRLHNKMRLISDSLYNSYCSIIHETDVDPYVSVISEKTIKPIVLKKIWITLSDNNYYDTMKFLGFDVFDDIFDLSFSRELEIDRRVDMFVKELVRMNSCDFKQLSADLEQRIIHNRHNLARAMSIDYEHRVNTLLELLNSVSA